jgi:hypothetical protein
MKIKEIFEVRKQTPEKLKTLEYIKEWRLEFNRRGIKIRTKSFGKFIIHDDGSVDSLSKTLIIDDYMLDEDGLLPVKFNSCNELTIYATRLRGFKNFPEKVLNPEKINSPISFVFGAKSTNLNSFEGFPSYINGTLDVSTLKHLNFSKVNNYIKSVNNIYFNKEYVGPLLSVLKINDLRRLTVFKSYNNKLEKAVEILGKYIESKDILGCQDELIENGLSQYAKL